MNNENKGFDRNNKINTNLKNSMRRNNRQNATSNSLKEKISNNKTRNLFSRNRNVTQPENVEEQLDNQLEKNVQEKQGVGGKLRDFISSDNKKGILRNKAKETAGTAGKTAIKAAKKIGMLLIKNPIFLVIMGFMLLIIIIPILWSASDSDNDSGDNSGISALGKYDKDCDFNQTKVSLLLDDGSYSVENLDLKDYVIGVAYAEVGSYIYLPGYEEYAKTIMVAAKTYAFTRGQYNSDTKKIVLKASTYDQAWCDIYSGCMYYKRGSGAYFYYSKASNISVSDAVTYKEALSDTNLEKAKSNYDAIYDYILVSNSFSGEIKSSSDIASIEYRDHTQNFWKKKSESGSNWKEIFKATGTSEYTDFHNDSVSQSIMNRYSGLKTYRMAEYCTFTPNRNGSNCSSSYPLDKEYTITSVFGPRTKPCPTCSGYHEGIDFGAPGGTPIYSVFDGVVLISGFGSSAGNWVRIGHDIDGDGVYDYQTQYMHMQELPMVNVNDFVKGGQQIGLVGTTGSSTGNHLHFGLMNSSSKLIDPKPLLDTLLTKTSVFDTASVCKK